MLNRLIEAINSQEQLLTSGQDREDTLSCLSTLYKEVIDIAATEYRRILEQIALLQNEKCYFCGNPAVSIITVPDDMFYAIDAYICDNTACEAKLIDIWNNRNEID